MPRGRPWGGLSVWGHNAPRRSSTSDWKRPLNGKRIRKLKSLRTPGKAASHRFLQSVADVFEKHATINQEREKLWPLIQATPNLDWHMITKRPKM